MIKNIVSVFLICMSFQFIACAQNAGKPQATQDETIKIPSGVKSATYDFDVNKDTTLVIEVTADNKMYMRESLGYTQEIGGTRVQHFQHNLLTDANFISETTNKLQDKVPDKRSVYIRVDVNLKFGKLAEFFEKMSKSEVEPNKAKFIVNPLKEVEKSQQTESGGYVLKLILPEKTDQLKNNGQTSGGNGSGSGDGPAPPPPPLPPGYKKSAEQIAAEEKAKKLATEKAEARKKIKVEKLIVEMDDAGKIKFNNNPQTPDEFTANLKKIFDERTAYDIFRDGTNEVDNTVYLKISPNVNYGEAIKLIDEIYGLGANQIYLDGLQNK